MKKAGEVLYQRRLAKNLSLSQIAEITKISVETLKAIEQNHYAQLPDLTFSLGFVRNYAQALGLDQDKLGALFKRSYKNYQQKTILPPCLDKPKRSLINPRLGWLSLVGIVILVMGLFIFIQLRNVFSLPKLKLDLPVEGQSVDQTVLIKGQTGTDTTLTVNGELISVDVEGNFTAQYQLTPGEDSLTFIATNRRGQETKLIRQLKPEQ